MVNGPSGTQNIEEKAGVTISKVKNVFVKFAYEEGAQIVIVILEDVAKKTCIEQTFKIEKDELGYLKESIDKMMESKVLYNTGSMPGDKKRYDQALEMYNQSLKIAKEIVEQQRIDSILNNIARIHHIKWEYDQALEMYNQSLKIAKENETQFVIGRTLNDIAMIHFKQKRI